MLLDLIFSFKVQRHAFPWPFLSQNAKIEMTKTVIFLSCYMCPSAEAWSSHDICISIYDFCHEPYFLTYLKWLLLLTNPYRNCIGRSFATISHASVVKIKGNANSWSLIRSSLLFIDSSGSSPFEFTALIIVAAIFYYRWNNDQAEPVSTADYIRIIPSYWGSGISFSMISLKWLCYRNNDHRWLAISCWSSSCCKLIWHFP